MMMKAIVPLIFYPWLAVSLVILGRRIWRKSTRPKGSDPTDARPITDTSQAVLARLAAEAPTPTPPATHIDGVAAAPLPRLPSLVGLADLVRGISMPCGLTPHLGAGILTPDRAAFTTDRSEPGEVEAGLRAELARLGMSDIRDTSTGFIAAGRLGEVEVRVHRSVTVATSAGLRAFEGALPDAVAVEMSVH